MKLIIASILLLFTPSASIAEITTLSCSGNPILKYTLENVRGQAKVWSSTGTLDIAIVVTLSKAHYDFSYFANQNKSELMKSLIVTAKGELHKPYDCISYTIPLPEQFDYVTRCYYNGLKSNTMYSFITVGSHDIIAYKHVSGRLSTSRVGSWAVAKPGETEGFLYFQVTPSVNAEWNLSYPTQIKLERGKSTYVNITETITDPKRLGTITLTADNINKGGVSTSLMRAVSGWELAFKTAMKADAGKYPVLINAVLECP